MRKGNAGEASGLPFVAGAVNCAIWLKYALLIDDSAMKLGSIHILRQHLLVGKRELHKKAISSSFHLLRDDIFR